LSRSHDASPKNFRSNLATSASLSRPFDGRDLLCEEAEAVAPAARTRYNRTKVNMNVSYMCSVVKT